MMESAAEFCLARASWQPMIFAEDPRRSDLLGLKPDWPVGPVRIAVLRNQPFEFVASVLTPFLAFSGWMPEFTYSAYSDTLDFEPAADTGLILVWLDFDRYQLDGDALLSWISERLAGLRRATDVNVLITDWVGPGERVALVNAGLRQIARDLPGVYVADQSGIGARLGSAYRDARTARIAGTTISDRASIATARQLGLAWLPALLEPGIKAVAVDLDGTLYGGVLGEDGPRGIAVSPAHLELQHHLLALKRSGVFLAALSRNDPQDVHGLFDERTDLALGLDDFSVVVASWDSKADGLRRIARELRIGEEAILLVDDNPGELAAVATEFPTIRCLHAADPALTARAMTMFPGLFRFSVSVSDRARVADLKAAAQRNDAMLRSQDPMAYLRSLEVELTLAVDDRAHVSRLSELSSKTNQFNTGLSRLSPAQVASYMGDSQRHAVSIALADRLSDSGIIGAVFTRRQGARLIVDEIAISCRALGRGLETIMIGEAVRRAGGGATLTEVVFRLTPGPRNEPARAWLAQVAGPFDPDAGEVLVPWTSLAQMPDAVSIRSPEKAA